MLEKAPSLGADQIPWTFEDSVAPAAKAADRPVGLGHTDLCSLFGPGHIDTSQRRQVGFASACQELGVTGAAVSCPSWNAAPGYQTATTYLARRLGQRPYSLQHS